MEQKNRNTISRSLSEVLRHKPGKLGLTLDKQGYVDARTLLLAINNAKMVPELLFPEDLQLIVKENNKQRFSYNFDGSKIRANQGHSIAVDLELKPTQPPFILYHGTDSHFVADILKQGLLKMKRQHVHLSDDKETALKVGQRKEKYPTILEVEAGLMYYDGFKFYKSDNGVWLTDHVPPKYIK